MNLSSREQEIVSLVCKGMTNFQIAKQLRVRENTVTDALTAIYEKLQVKTRYQMIVRVFKGDSNKEEIKL